METHSSFKVATCISHLRCQSILRTKCKPSPYQIEYFGRVHNIFIFQLTSIAKPLQPKLSTMWHGLGKSPHAWGLVWNTKKSLVEPTTNYWNGNSPYWARHVPRWMGPYYHSTEKAVELGAQHHGLLSVQMRNASWNWIVHLWCLAET
jgi:hypothetical protein